MQLFFRNYINYIFQTVCLVAALCICVNHNRTPEPHGANPNDTYFKESYPRKRVSWDNSKALGIKIPAYAGMTFF